MAGRRRAAAAVLLLTAAGLVLGAAPAAADTLRLPTPAQQGSGDLLSAVQARPDRALVSRVPGPARNDEHVLVGLDGGGAPAQVQVEQHVVLSGQGDFQVRERGPARAARSLSEESAPVTKFGAVVWQGFTSGTPPRELAALLTLDPALEQPRLPLSVSVSFTPDAGAPEPLGPGGAVPGAGTVVVSVADRTAQPADLPTATDVAAPPVARALDAVRAVASRAPGPRLPAAGRGLPAEVSASGPAAVAGTSSVPLRLTGTLQLTGATGRVLGPGTSPTPGGAAVAGTLSGVPVRFEVHADGPGTLALDLTAVPALDPRVLVPPGGARSWSAWAARGPDRAARTAALDLLVSVAATGARATAFSPYLGADLPGTGTTHFSYAFAPATAVTAVRAPLQVREGAVALAGLAGLLVFTGAVGVWRHS